MPDIPPPPFLSGSAHYRRERYRGAPLGLAVGDALGTTLEFCPRDYHPTHTEMLGGGAFDVAPGEWTDDTAMALCLAASLIECRDFDHPVPHIYHRESHYSGKTEESVVCLSCQCRNRWPSPALVR